MSERALFDPGLQPERTELAWRRTALAIAIGSLLSLRVLPLALPPAHEAWGFAPGLVGLLAAGGVWLAARRRQVRMSDVLTGPSPGTGFPGASLMLVLTMLGVGFGAVALVFVALSVQPSGI